jgi:glutathione S-transferase
VIKNPEEGFSITILIFVAFSILMVQIQLSGELSFMKLFYSAGSCSTSCHISLEESGLKYEAVGIDWDNSSDPNVQEVTRLNPLGTLPVFLTDQGTVLDQNVAIHTYIADQARDRHLLPSAGTPERAQAINWLAFVGTDLHKSFSPLFGLESFSKDERVRSEFKNWAVSNVNSYLSYLNNRLEGKDYLLGKNFTVADSYCFVVSNWTKWLEIPIDSYKNLQKYLDRVYQRPAVQKVLKLEGLLD